MKVYSIVDPVYSEKIMIPESTDPAHADNINQAPKQLLQNTIALKKQIDEMNQRASITRSVLAAGATSVTIEDDRITADSVLSFFTSIFGVNPTAASVDTGSVTLTFKAQTEDMEVGVRVDA